MQKSKLSRPRIGGREVQAEGTACTKGLCPGVSEKFGVIGGQGHVARTGSGSVADALVFLPAGDWRQEDRRLEINSILA